MCGSCKSSLVTEQTVQTALSQFLSWGGESIGALLPVIKVWWKERKKCSRTSSPSEVEIFCKKGEKDNRESNKRERKKRSMNNSALPLSALHLSLNPFFFSSRPRAAALWQLYCSCRETLGEAKGVLWWACSLSTPIAPSHTPMPL